ncbi:GroES-like protein [Glarea lozoyensis ATCC 20868]|uniref:GroES-like protein n=1 Tax=Glarea lozoyensis (strain ATCC 20868 / MF5171) TaxID=1116229 RepID=S3CX14_GLAL2|nr:GroES-like protein [Glarea lozoyensis ATCC 20868]EPE24351.1 GroES-like protein [Glarea lozoyensis ATCC 20868]
MNTKTSQPSNSAAWLPSLRANLKIGPSPYTSPLPDQIAIKTRAIAINPVDWMVQTAAGGLVYPHLKTPFVAGTDVAGEVVEIGSSVTRFKVGDRVLGYAIGTAGPPIKAGSHESAFQEYVVLREHLSSPVPDAMSFEEASIIPMGISTAACGLFQDDQLGLQLPSSPPAKPTGKTLIIWGGSTSVGCNTIQLAVAAGYEVITTCSPKNFKLVKSLGATHVFDYNSPTVIADITNLMKTRISAGAYSIGSGAADACRSILSHCNGSKFIAMATYPVPQKPLELFVLPRTMFGFVTWNIKHWILCKFLGVNSKFIFGYTLIDNGVGKMLYADYLPEALKEGTFVSSPAVRVVGRGLESVQPAFEVQRKGVSAEKIVVSL